MAKRLYLLLPTQHTSKGASTTKEGLEDIKWVMHPSSTSHSLLEGILTILIINLSFFRITEDLISLS